MQPGAALAAMPLLCSRDANKRLATIGAWLMRTGAPLFRELRGVQLSVPDALVREAQTHFLAPPIVSSMERAAAADIPRLPPSYHELLRHLARYLGAAPQAGGLAGIPYDGPWLPGDEEGPDALLLERHWLPCVAVRAQHGDYRTPLGQVEQVPLLWPAPWLPVQQVLRYYDGKPLPPCPIIGRPC